MGAAQQIEIHGEKGGSSKPKSPVEASDSLRSTNLAKLLIAVGEGEFDGIPTDYDIYLDNTPIRDASGQIVAAISVASTVPYMPLEKMQSLVPTVQKAAQAVCAELGART